MIVRLEEGEEQRARVESRPLDRAGSLRIASVRARSRPIAPDSIGILVPPSLDPAWKNDFASQLRSK